MEKQESYKQLVQNAWETSSSDADSLQRDIGIIEGGKTFP